MVLFIYLFNFHKRKMLTNSLKTLIYKLFLEIFYKKNDKIINFSINFLYFS